MFPNYPWKTSFSIKSEISGANQLVWGYTEFEIRVKIAFRLIIRVKQLNRKA